MIITAIILIIKIIVLIRNTIYIIQSKMTIIIVILKTDWKIFINCFLFTVFLF